ncbi:MAG: energy-coupling factor transporter transmembrane component T family protein [Mastigocoleus sp.]
MHHKLSLDLRLQLALVIVIGAAFLKIGAWYWLGVYGAIAICWSCLLRVSIRKLVGILGLELLFLSLMALPLGWEKASFLLVRSLVCLLVMNSFLLTLPPHSFGIALKGLPLPGVFKETLLLAGQYLEILLSEVTRMQRSAQLRGLGGTASWVRYASSAMVGAFFLRSLNRSERVYAAMLARGYNGSLPIDTKMTARERFIVLSMCAAITVLTVASYTVN